MAKSKVTHGRCVECDRIKPNNELVETSGYDSNVVMNVCKVCVEKQTSDKDDKWYWITLTILLLLLFVIFPLGLALSVYIKNCGGVS